MQAGMGMNEVAPGGVLCTVFRGQVPGLTFNASEILPFPSAPGGKQQPLKETN